MVDAAHRAWQRAFALPALIQDCVMYGVAALFALATALFASSSDYRGWGQMSAVAYLVGLLAALAVFVRVRQLSTERERAELSRAARHLIVIALAVGAVLIPLVAEVTWRAESQPGAHAQPEVTVIERAGDRLAAHHGPYLANPTTVGSAPSSDRRSIDLDSYFPYLPGMALFGLPNSLHLPTGLLDARLALFGFTALVSALALVLSRASGERKLRVVQFLFVLPSGALPIVTGGDDLPVLALMLLGLVFAARRAPLLAGLTFGIAGTLKFTAWPLLLLVLLSARDDADRRAPFRYALGAGAVLVPSIGLAYGSARSAFVENVVRFPLGLGHIRSPAASPLLGQVLTTLFRPERRVVTVLLLVAGLVVVLLALLYRTPRTPATAARFTAFALVLATVLAPATRFGYLIYPVNLLLFGYLLEEVPSVALAPEDQPSSSTWKMRSATRLDSAGVSPPSAGEMDGLADSTPTPISQ